MGTFDILLLHKHYISHNKYKTRITKINSMNWKYLIFAIFVQLLGTNEAKRDPPEVIKDGSGEGLEKDLVVTIIKKAKGQKFEGDLLKVTYIGRNDGPRGPIFGESKPGGTFAYTLGHGGVIMGYSLGTPGMCLGETRTLLVPPHIGYGGNRNMHFTVKLVEIEKGKDVEDSETEEGKGQEPATEEESAGIEKEIEKDEL